MPVTLLDHMNARSERELAEEINAWRDASRAAWYANDLPAWQHATDRENECWSIIETQRAKGILAA